MAVPKVLAALNLARQMTTAVMEPASIKWSFRPPPSPEHPRQIRGSPPCSERAPASQAPQIPALGVETFYGVREGGASQHRRLHNIYDL